MKRVNQKGLAGRTTAWILSAALVFSACPVSVQAEENTEEHTQVTEEQQSEEKEESKGFEEEDSEKAEAEEGKESEAQEKELEEEASETETKVEESDAAENSEEESLEEKESQEEITTEAETTEEETTIEEETVALFAQIGNVTRTCPTIGRDGAVTFHYYPEAGEEVDSAYVKGSWSGDWSKYYYMTEDESGVWSVTADLSLDKSYEYGIVVNENWVGDPANPRNGGNSEIIRNPHFNSDGSVTIFYYPQGDENVKLLYKTADDAAYKSITMTQDAQHSALLSATVTEQGDYTYALEVSGSRTADVNCKEAAFSINKLPEDDASVKSPVVNGNQVVFHYFAPTAGSVNLAGTMNDWSSSATALTYDETTGFWSVEQELVPGRYEYKFVVDGNWYTDPRNEVQSSGNSLCIVSGLESTALDVEAGKEAVLPASLRMFDEDGTASDVTPEYTIEEQYQDILTLTDGKIAVPSDFTAESFKVIASYAGYSSEVVINVQANVYTYTIYYLDDSHQDVSSASLWIWSDGVNGTQYFFTDKEELEDGNTWLKAEVAVPFAGLYIIPRAHDDWSWQDVDKAFDNTAAKKNVTLYLLNGDTTVYTSIPDAVEKEYRYVIVEYNRLAEDYTGWNIYSWNTGYGSEVTVDFKEIAGKMAALIPVVDTKESISFCMRRSEEGNPWAEKDGGDHTVAIPLNQKVVKASFEQGEGITGNLPYNIGYETDVTAGEITFYYRDDALYEKYEEASLEGKIKLVWDGAEYEMTYDAQNERYFYTGKLEAGEHYYGYQIDGSLVLDRFNEETVEVEGVTYSAYQYAAFDAELTASVSLETMDYNDNAVLKLTLGTDTDEIEVAEAYADLSALGQSSKFVIDPALMEGTIAVHENVPAGKKEIPVTVKDQFGNLYTTTAAVTVVSRDNSNDFDWDEAVIYFAVTDRFFDGNSSNNDAYGTGSYDVTQGSMYHGGDFAGLEAKLDYLQDLGVNTIWITPIVENIEDVFTCDGYTNQYNSGYHGYWASDFTKLNKHLGTEEEFSELIDALHARGMKLMVDVVLNHAGYGMEEAYDNTYIPGKNMLRDKTTTVKGDDKKDGLSGLPDFVTEDADVRNMLVAWQTAWVSKYDIDYFRVDTVKHVDDTTWKAFKNALTYVNPDFKMIGEYAGSGYATNAGQLGTGQMDAILDFDFNDQALAFVNGNLASVESFMEGRNAGIDNTATVGSFLSSHDEDGLMYRMMNESGKFSQEKAYDLMKVAAAFQITAKGQPVIYYGEELGQTGANNWPYQTNRYDMDWASANEDNDMLVHYQKLLEIRNEYTDVFAKGQRSTVKLDESNGTLVVSRAYGGEALYVGFNINQTEAKNVVVSLNAGTTYTDLYSGNNYTADKNGEVTITIPSAADGGTVILKAGENKAPEKTETTVDSKSTGSSKESNTASVPVKVVLQPTYTKMDGTIVSGWKNVIREAVMEAEANRVPLAGSAEEAVNAQALVVDIMLEENTVKTIGAEEVKSMVESGADFRFHYGKDIVLVFTNSTLAEVAGDLDLNILISTDKDFGQGFQSIVLDPRKKAIYGTKIAAAFQLGAENAGKTAFIFCRNLTNNQVELMTTCVINTDGTIAMPNVDYTDVIILY